ncbi:hypothetical protein [Natronomonas sp. LN261]|jgi:hypothetical protein|uniref:hypothetical protein n=1 Tax=Natronomonas sp. LN261 TaxID=2750669 RepID=UPI0015EF7035|nr:hypothetical protein [Natronomonas sp. LN261]
MGDEKTEACGRCSMTTVVDAAVDSEERNPFGEKRIEVDEAEFRRVSPAAWLAGLGHRLDAAVRKLTYER